MTSDPLMLQKRYYTVIDKTHNRVKRTPLKGYNYKYSVGDALVETSMPPNKAIKYKVMGIGFFMSPEPEPKAIAVYMLEVFIPGQEGTHIREKSASWVDSDCRPVKPAEQDRDWET